MWLDYKTRQTLTSTLGYIQSSRLLQCLGERLQELFSDNVSAHCTKAVGFLLSYTGQTMQAVVALN